MSKSLGKHSAAMERHVERIQPIKYCKNPEYYLQEAACDYIKENPYEESDSYQVRLSRAYSSFEPIYTHLRNLVIGTALRKKIVVNNSNTDWDKFFKNIDLEGNNLQVYIRKTLAEAVDGGWCGILVDYPQIPPGLSKEEERRRYPNARPYFTRIKSEQILDTQFKSDNDTMLDESDYGRQLSLLRIADIKLVDDPQDEFTKIQRRAEKVFDYEIVDGVQKVRYRYFVQTEGDMETSEPKFEQEGQSIYLSTTIIPYIIVPGGEDEGDGIYRPLMLDTARLNMQHWVMSADLSNMINTTANPRFVISGVWDRMKGILQSTSRALVLQDKDSKADWKGAPMDGANIIRLRLMDLLQSMKNLAVVAMNPSQTIQPQSGVAKVIDKSQSDSLLNVLVTSLEMAMNQAIKIAAEYMKDGTIPEISLNKHFGAAPLHSQQILAFIELFNAKVMDAKLLLELLEAGDVFEGLPDFTVESIVSRLDLDENGRPVAEALAEVAATREPQEGGSEPREADAQ